MRSLVTLVLILATASGCATGATSPILGRSVKVLPANGGEKQAVAGELLAVEPERIWVLGKERVVALPLESVAEVSLERHRMSKARGLAWAGIGALTTGAALGAACGSVEDAGCGEVVLAVGLTWLLLGALPALSLDDSAKTRIERPGPDSLRPYARFPQGPPEGVDLLQLPPKPSQERKER